MEMLYFPKDAGQYAHGNIFEAVLRTEQTEEDEAEENDVVKARLNRMVSPFCPTATRRK